LMYAASAGKDAVVHCLLICGADPNLVSSDGFSALDLAGSIQVVRLLRKVA